MAFPTPKFIKYLENPQKYVGDVSNITARSSWEQKFVRWCDLNPSVKKWSSETTVVPYWSQADNKKRRYFVDFTIQVEDSEGKLHVYMVEVKPAKEMVPPTKGNNRKRYLEEVYTWAVNNDKWAAARDYAKKHNVNFIVLNEYDLGIKSANRSSKNQT